MDATERAVLVERYRVERMLGRGGMGTVLQVVDLQTGSMLALKQLELSPASADREQRVSLFKREYHVLSQLQHPNVVRALEYGLNGDTPFYTMELLSGRTLRELAPLPWRAACGYLIEICSALSLLHTRGFVHRDLTPANVIVTDERVAKLIDFGAMVPMGPCKLVVGTPPFMAPETLEHAALDGRSDTFSLGALAYWILSGRHAYPAPDIASLSLCWKRLPASLSELDADIPVGLSLLVAEMLSLSPDGRPAQLAEVAQRLSQLLGRPTPPVTAAHLNAHLRTPKLSGRESQLERVRQYIVDARRGQGVALMLVGESGSGRSRLLDEVALEARLAGLFTLQARAGDANSEGSLIRALLGAAVQYAAEAAASAAAELLPALQPLWPRAAELASSSTPISGELAEHVLAFFERLQERARLAICVDDLEQCDPASARIVAQLAHRLGRRCFFAFCTLPPAEGESPALTRLRARAEPLQVQELTQAQVEELLRSLFGELPGLQALAGWVHQVASGRPAACMEVATHLISRGAITFHAGRFQLRATLDDLDLPRSLEDVLAQRWLELNEPAREALTLLALSSGVCSLSVSMLLSIMRSRSDEATAHAAFTALLGRRLIAVEQEICSFSNVRFAAYVLEASSSELRPALAFELAELLAAQGPDSLAVAAYFYAQAGAYDLQLAAVSKVDAARLTGDGPIANFARTPRGLRMYEGLLERCKQTGESPYILFRFRKAMLLLAAVFAPELIRYAPETLEQLRYDVGLDQWDALASIVDPMQRLMRCFETADQRFRAAPAAERGLPPAVALKELGTCVALLVGAYGPMYETTQLDALAGLMEPLRTLAPVLDIVYLTAKLAGDSVTRGCFFVEARRDIARRLGEPIAGMDTLTQTGARLLMAFYVALEVATRGSEEAVEVALELERHPQHAVLGAQLKLMAALCRGDASAARTARDERAYLALRTIGSDPHLETSLRWEAVATYRAGDLLGVRQLITAQSARVQRLPKTRPWLHMLKAAYLLLTLQPERALEEIRAGQLLAPPLTHSAWRDLALLEMEAWIALDRPDLAGRCAEKTEALLQSQGLDTRYEDRLLMARAAALVARAELEPARQLLNETVQRFEAVAQTSVALASLHEALARVALLQGDVAGWNHALGVVERIYLESKFPGLVARHVRLVASGPRDARVSIAPPVQHTTVASRIAVLERDEQVREILVVALEESAAAHGYLYRCQKKMRLEQLAQRGATPRHPQLAAAIEACLLERDDERTVSMVESEASTLRVDGVVYSLVLLRDPATMARIIGVIALAGARNAALEPVLLSMLGRILDGLESTTA